MSGTNWLVQTLIDYFRVPRRECIPLLAGRHETSVVGGPDELGSAPFDPSSYDSGNPAIIRSIVFAATPYCGAASSVALELFNETDGVTVVTLTTTSTVPIDTQSRVLVIGTDLPNSRKLYSVRATKSGGLTTDKVGAKYAAFEVSYNSP